MTSGSAWTVLGLGAALLLAGCTIRPEQVRGANWIGPAQSAKAASFYPAKALRQHKTGMVALNCFMEQNRRLDDCRVVYEYPKGYGFGEAALRMYSSIVIRTSQAEVVNAAADTNHHRVTMPVSFARDRASCLAVQEAWQTVGVNLIGAPSC